MQVARASDPAASMVISEYDYDHYDDELRQAIDWHYRVGSVTDEAALEYAVRMAQAECWVDRLEATIESHIMPTARVRERCGIPGTSVRAAWLCRDKPSMKQVLREAGIPTAASAAVSSYEEAQAFVEEVGYPVIMKPRDGAGAAATFRISREPELLQAAASSGLFDGNSVAIEEFVLGHEGFLDTITVRGEVQAEFVSHYFPNVLAAMRTRWISPQIITTNRLFEPQYEEVRQMARDVIGVLGLDTSATHMEWFFGPKGLRFSEIGARPPGVGQWDLYGEANDVDVYEMWANALVHGDVGLRPSYRFSCGIVALRPNQDGRITGYTGVEELHARYGENITAAHLPPPGTPTQEIEAGYHANAWVRARHPDFDTTKGILSDIGETLKVWAG